jgi:tetraacyldisaccharide 4'-kinase
MKIWQILLLPFSYSYGFITYLRNKFFDIGLLPVSEYSSTVISVGNLTAGGTGKTPHIEYLIRLIGSKYSVATLSGGYGRRGSGFVLASENSTARDIGDEPRQFKKKFPGLLVAVDKHRRRGIKKLLNKKPDLHTILLDDAFQHRYVKPGLSILLTDYGQMYYNDRMLPSGTLREFVSGIRRADIIVVTKTPSIFSPLDRRLLLKKIAAEEYQRIYFSYIKYGEPHPCSVSSESTENLLLDKNITVLLLTGIANPTPLEQYLRPKVKKLIPCEYSDHHNYSLKDIQWLEKAYHSLTTQKKVIITTEKDAMRLEKPELQEILKTLPLFYIPIEIAFHEKDQEDFNRYILNYVRTT